MLPYRQALKSNARTLRSLMTDAERKVWSCLRRKQLCGAQFYRQKPLGPYIVDFYCASANLVIEIDGGQHYSPSGQDADQERDAALSKLGLRVLRFTNEEVLRSADDVLERIYGELLSRLPDKNAAEGRGRIHGVKT